MVRRLLGAVLRVALATLLLGGCGSTVQSAGRPSSSGELGGATGGRGADALSGSPTDAAEAAAVSAAVAPAQATRSPASAGAKRPTVSVEAAAPIRVGIPYLDPQATETFTSALGKGLAGTDAKAEYSAYIDDLNRRGGIAGHRVIPQFHVVRPSDSPSTYESATCAAFTQDNHVQFVFDIGMSMNFLHCVLNGGVLAVLNTGWLGLNDADMRATPGLLFPDAMTLDRLARLQADNFVASGLLTRDTKVGIMYFDEPHFAAAEKVLEAELTRRHIQVVDRFAAHYVASTDDVGQAAGDAQSAQLRFRSRGVNTVLFVETNAWLAGAFGIQAASQQYYPRYGYTSNEPLANVASNVPADALRGAQFIGWRPAQDVTDSRALSPGAQACLKFMADHGNPTESGNQKSGGLTVCENVEYLRAVLETVGGGAVSRSTFLDAAARLGRRYGPMATFSIDMAGRSDGAAAVRHGVWDTGCGCFAYTSAPSAI